MPTRRLSPFAFLVAALLPACTCGSKPEAPAAPETPSAEPAAAPAPEEACARILVVSYDGATPAVEGVARNKGEAQSRAETLRTLISQGQPFEGVARAESDAPSSRARGGMIGTYARNEWPEIHQAVRDGVFEATVGGLSPVVEAPYGYVFAQRCPVEKVHVRHILVRYAGARNAADDVTRTQEDARIRAVELRNDVMQPDADFEAIAREHSEDGSASRGGDLGSVGRGRFEPPFEDAAFRLQPGEISPVVETAFGYHIIQRVD